MNTNTRFTLAILSPLLEAIEAGEDPAKAVRAALDALETQEAPLLADPDHPLQIILPEGEVRHIRALNGCVEATAKQLSWLKGVLAQQQHLLLDLIEELKGYHNVPAEVPYNLSLANTEGEITCFVREDLTKKVAELKNE